MQSVDPESLEIENDREIAALGERVGLLKSVRRDEVSWAMNTHGLNTWVLTRAAAFPFRR